MERSSTLLQHLTTTLKAVMKRKSTTDATARSRIPVVHFAASVGVCTYQSLTEWRDILNLESHLKGKPGWLTHSSDWLRGEQPEFDSRQNTKNKQYTRTDLWYSFPVALRRSLLVRLTSWSAYSEDNVIALCPSHCIPSCMLTSVRTAQCGFLDSWSLRNRTRTVRYWEMWRRRVR